MTRTSHLEETLALQIKALGLPEPEREYRFHPTRRYRCDFAWPRPSHRLIVEVEGGQWIRGKDGQRGGRHNRPQGFSTDCEKYNAAVLQGWRLLRVTEKHIRTGDAIRWIEQALRACDGEQPPARPTHPRRKGRAS